MNALAILYVNDHLQVLLDEAAMTRMVRTVRPSLTQRIASAVSSVRTALAMPLDNRGTIVPKLNDSPNRS